MPLDAINKDLGSVVTHTAAAAGTFLSPILQNRTCAGVVVVLDVTAISGTTPSVTVTIQGYDPASNKYYTLLASAARTTTGTVTLTVYPGSTVTANVSANSHVPEYFRVQSVIAGTGVSVTATISACLLY